MSRRPVAALWGLFATSLALAAPPAARLHLAGDSTVATKERRTPNPEYGWGEMLPRYFRDPGRIVNHGVNGRSTKSFLDLGHWEKLRGSLAPGDWVIIQFGHNDSKRNDPSRFTEPRGEFAANLRRFVAEVRAAQAHPVLATSVARRHWSQGRLVDTHGDYLAVTHEVAAAERVPLLDLHALTSELERAHGEEGSKRLHLWIAADTYARKPEGWRDDTHYSAYGADRVAALVVQELIRLRLEPAQWLAADPVRADAPAAPPPEESERETDR